MKRKPRRKSPAAVAKARLSQMNLAYDVTTASAEVVGYRTALFARDLARSTGLPHPEAITMTAEKLLVAGQAVMAMTRPFGAGHRLWTDFCLQQMQRALSALPQAAGIASPARFMEVAARAAGQATADWLAFCEHAMNLTELAASAGAQPIRRAVRANARRLAKAG